MPEKYYRVRDIVHPDKSEIVVRVKDGKLECLTGEGDNLKKFGCVISNGKLEVGNKYYETPITKEKADQLKFNYDNEQSRAIEASIIIPENITGGGYPD
jgi:hypothetical protein